MHASVCVFLEFCFLMLKTFFLCVYKIKVHKSQSIKIGNFNIKKTLGIKIWDEVLFFGPFNTGWFVSEGTWDTENPYTRAIGSVTAPIVKMLAVAGKLWCGRQNNICVINPLTLTIEVNKTTVFYCFCFRYVLF